MSRGKAVLEALALRFPQLYVAPSPDSADAYRLAATRGIAPEEASLAHFTTSVEDELREVQTPAGPVEVLFLKNREDFTTFLQIVGHRAQPVPIAPSVGAITYLGLADWGKIAAARDAYIREGGDKWPWEFARLAKESDTFRSQLIVISEGPYSNVSAGAAGYGEDEWLRVSREIRLNHECTHVVCRRLMPNDILEVWDEVDADVCGIMCATGSYDAALAALFLGVSEDGYEGGRLEEYLNDDKRSHVDVIAREVHAALMRVGELSRDLGRDADPFEFALALKREPLILY